MDRRPINLTVTLLDIKAHFYPSNEVRETNQGQKSMEEIYQNLQKNLQEAVSSGPHQRWPLSEPVQIWSRKSSEPLVWTHQITDFRLNRVWTFSRKKKFLYRLSSDSDLKLVWTRDKREKYFKLRSWSDEPGLRRRGRPRTKTYGTRTKTRTRTNGSESLKRDAGIHGPPNWSELLNRDPWTAKLVRIFKRDAGIHGSPNWSAFWNRDPRTAESVRIFKLGSRDRRIFSDGVLENIKMDKIQKTEPKIEIHKNANTVFVFRIKNPGTK